MKDTYELINELTSVADVLCMVGDIRHCIAVKASKVKQKVCDDYTISLTIKNVKKRQEVEKLR